MSVITPVDGRYGVKVGEIPHPMLEKHFISFIALATSNEVNREFLMPDEEPVAFFSTKNEAVSACVNRNIHGLWKSQFDINFRQEFSKMDPFYPMRSFSYLIMGKFTRFLSLISRCRCTV